MKKLLIKFLVKYYLEDIIAAIPRKKMPIYTEREDWSINYGNGHE